MNDITIDQDTFDKLYTVYSRAADVVNFCYSQDGCWIGTEIIRKSDTFLKLIYRLYLAVMSIGKLVNSHE